MLITNNVIRSATRDKSTRLACVVICRENETFLESLAKLDCDFYIIRQPGLSDWKSAIANKPDNVYLIDDLTDNHSTSLSKRSFELTYACLPSMKLHKLYEKLRLVNCV